MKNKRIVLSILAIALIACIACVAVACGEKGKDKFTVSFGGEGVSGISSQEVESGACAQRPQDPQRDGYEFKGWAEEGQSTLFDFATPITKNTALVAVWEEVKKNELGSKDNPYLIATADDLADFADKVNHPEEDDNEKYAKSYFKLVADIDMEGIPYVSAGQLVTLNEGEENERKVYGFSGNFDGNGHTISNLTIKRNLRSGMAYVGLFGYCHRATITNLTLDNVSYAVVSGADKNDIGAYVGGIVGYGNLTNISNVRVSGEFNMSLCASNPSRIGGIAGGLDVYDSETAYIAYVKNCVSEVKVVAKKFEDDGSASSLDSAVNGGIIGATSTASNGALAVLNCVTTANAAVEGGEWVGGIMGYASCSRMSIINCANYARVKATNKDVSYVGGIIGYSSNDNTILDCFSTGRVTATRATSTTYKSYAGGIAGYTFTDDYSGGYYDAGTVIENCFYKLAPSTTDKTNAAGTKAEEGATFDAEWIAQNVKWDMSEWALEGGIAIPKTDTALSGTHTVSLVKGDTIIKEEVRQFDASSFAIVGKLDALSNEGNNLFFDWEFESGARYRYYVPVVKDMTFKACFGDSSKVTHVYTGKGEYHGQVDGGVLYLAPDGTLKLVNGNAIGGKYTYDGNNILLLTFYNNYGDVSATLTEDGSIKLVFDYGMSGQVEYTYTKSDLKVFGEYYNEDGDVLTFSDGIISYQSESLKNEKGIVKSYSGTYTIDGNDITIESKWLTNYFTSMSATVNEDMTLTVNFVGKNGVAGYTNAIFAQPTANYKGQPFVGTMKYSDGYGYSKVTYTITVIGDHAIMTESGFDYREDPYSKDTILEKKADAGLAAFYTMGRNKQFIVEDNGIISGYGSSALKYGWFYSEIVDGTTVYHFDFVVSTSLVQKTATVDANGNYVVTGSGETSYNGIYGKDVDGITYYGDSQYIFGLVGETSTTYVYVDAKKDSHYATISGDLAVNSIITVSYGEGKSVVFTITKAATATADGSLKQASSERGTYNGDKGAIFLDGFGKATVDGAAYSYYINGANVVVLSNETSTIGVTIDTEIGVYLEKTADGKAQLYKQNGSTYYTFELDGFGGANYIYKSSYSSSITRGTYEFSSDGATVTIAKVNSSVNGTYNIQDSGKVLVESTSERKVFIADGYTVTTHEEDFVGYYVDAKGNAIEITIEDGRIWLAIAGRNQRLTANWNGTVLSYSAKDDDAAEGYTSKYSDYTLTLVEGNVVISHGCITGYDSVYEEYLRENKSVTYTKTEKPFAFPESARGTWYLDDNTVVVIAEKSITVGGVEGADYNVTEAMFGTNYEFSIGGKKYMVYEDSETAGKWYYCAADSYDAIELSKTEHAATLDAFAGTWEKGSDTLVFDGKGNGAQGANTFTYVVGADGKATYTYGGRNWTAVLASDGKSIEVSYYDDDAMKDISITYTKKVSGGAAVTADMQGTFTGTNGYTTNYTLIVGENSIVYKEVDSAWGVDVNETITDYTITDDGWTITWTMSGTTYKFTNPTGYAYKLYIGTDDYTLEKQA